MRPVLDWIPQGKYALDLATENKVMAAMMAHPSGIAMPHGLVNVYRKSKAALLFNACEIDQTVRPAEPLSLSQLECTS